MKRLALLLLIVALVACEYRITGYPQQPAMTAPPAVTDSGVHVHWRSGVDDIAKACPASDGAIIYACASWSQYGTTTVCDIQALQPKDFNDEALLAVLGHELFHCLGAQHGAP
jgi:hypothetical protein